jgi:nitroreductase
VIYPAIWSALLAARAEGVGGTITILLRYHADDVCKLLGVPTSEGWRMTTMLALGYPLGRRRRPPSRARGQQPQPLGSPVYTGSPVAAVGTPGG